MYTIKKNKIIIEVNQIGKLYEIKRTSGTHTLTAYSRKKDINNKINLLIQPLTQIKSVLGV